MFLAVTFSICITVSIVWSKSEIELVEIDLVEIKLLDNLDDKIT